MAAADATSTLRLGTMVLANDYRHPVLVAKEAATIDLLSGGRLEPGIGAGCLSSDYEAPGIHMERAGLRVDRLTESHAVMRGMWDDGPRPLAGETHTNAGHDGISQPTNLGAPPLGLGSAGP